MTQTAPPPLISNLVPSSYPASNTSELITINGSNFQSGATLTFHDPQAQDSHFPTVNDDCSMREKQNKKPDSSLANQKEHFHLLRTVTSITESPPAISRDPSRISRTTAHRVNFTGSLDSLGR